MTYSESPQSSRNSIGNPNAIALLALVAFAVAAAQHVFGRIPLFSSPSSPTGIMAVLAGGIVALVVYLPIKYLYTGPTMMNNNQVISMSVLVGIITAYFLVFEISPGLPSVSAAALAVFLFYYHIDQISQVQTK